MVHPNREHMVATQAIAKSSVKEALNIIGGDDKCTRLFW
jgi:hypothetical protein